MITPSLFSATGLSISAWDPTITPAGPSYVPRGSLIFDDLASTASSYQHTILADGGWDSAGITLSMSFAEAENWFVDGLNRHIEVFNPALERVWAGFVNMITLSMGPLSAQRGPLMDISNRVSVTYSPILYATTVPPIEGSETTTTLADDATSQAAYGFLESVVAGGKLLDDGTTDDATQLRDVYLEENKDPQTSEDLDFSGGSTATIQLDLLGYRHRFQKWIYQDTTAATVQIDTKIQLVITADPNGLFSTDFSQIATNASLTNRQEDDNRMAWDVLAQEVSLGDTNNDRYTLGVYDNQKSVYAIVPTTVEYQHAITDPALQIEQFGGGNIVQPWDVLPARWLFLVDFLAGRGLTGALRDDPRYLFIESVQFAAPNSLQVSGQKVSRIPQMIARLGA